MYNVLSGLYAGYKVAYDKTVDYIGYYSGYIEDANLEIPDDDLNEFRDYIKVENYTNENYNKRILPKVNIYHEYSVFLGPPTHIIDNIYLGSAYNAASYQTLKNHNISLIINITKEISNYYPNDFQYKRYDIYDNNKNSIISYLEQACDDIKEFQNENKSGNILLHCFMGASRSASVLIYYIMINKTKPNGEFFTFDEALDFIKSKRTIVNPTFRLTKDLAKSIYCNPKLIQSCINIDNIDKEREENITNSELKIIKKLKI